MNTDSSPASSMTPMEKYIMQREVDLDTVADPDEDSEPIDKPIQSG